LYADVAGHSRLTGTDEDATHKTLNKYLDLFSQTIEFHYGQVMHYAGDAILARFEAAVDALSCASVVQQQLAEHIRRRSHSTWFMFIKRRCPSGRGV
jgi:adenylate cyclase